MATKTKHVYADIRYRVEQTVRIPMELEEGLELEELHDSEWFTGYNIAHMMEEVGAGLNIQDAIPHTKFVGWGVEFIETNPLPEPLIGRVHTLKVTRDMVDNANTQDNPYPSDTVKYTVFKIVDFSKPAM